MDQSQADTTITELKARIVDLESKNTELESTLYKIYLAGYPSPLNIAEVVEKADQERVRLKQELQKWKQCAEDLNSLVERLQNILPWGVIKLQDRPPDPKGILPSGDKWREIEWSNTQVGVSLFFRSNGKDHTELWTGTGIFDGNIEQAVFEVTEQVVFALNRMPTPADLGNQSLDGLNMKQILLVLRELAYYRYLSRDQYKTKRREIFDRIEDMIVSPNENASRQEKMDRFYKLVENTFKKFERRRKKFIFSKSNL